LRQLLVFGINHKKAEFTLENLLNYGVIGKNIRNTNGKSSIL
jgi:hypothetical protein